MIDREALRQAIVAADEAYLASGAEDSGAFNEAIEAAITAYLTHAGEGAVPEPGYGASAQEWQDHFVREQAKKVAALGPVAAAPHPPRQDGAREGELVEPPSKLDPNWRSRCKELWQKLGRDQMLRQGDPVETLMEFYVEVWIEGWQEGDNTPIPSLAALTPLDTTPPAPDEAEAEPRPEDAWPHAVAWAVERWKAEVANRELVNVHRRSLDDTWRQVIRHFGGNPDELCGPPHDELLARSRRDAGGGA